MTLEEALKKGTEILKQGQIDAPAREAGVLLSNVLDKDKSYIYAYGSSSLSREQALLYEKWLAERSCGKPLQYITGVQEFMSLSFKVNENVLIPRHDTETLVEAVIEYAGKSGNRGMTLLDIGTGSGCIAVSLAYYIGNCTVTAADISEAALAVARENAQTAGVASKVEFICSNLFSALGNDKYDVITSNPPYIPLYQKGSLQREVSGYEPGLALFGGEDGLDFYRKIIIESPRYLNKNGILFFEVGAGQAADVLRLMEPGFHSLKAYKDLAGIDRVVSGSVN